MFTRIASQSKTVLKSVLDGGIDGFALCLINYLESIGLHNTSRVAHRSIIYWRWVFIRIKKPFRRVLFITFADGIIHTNRRIAEQALATKVFSRVIAEDKASLGVEFYDTFKSHVEYPRGFGYWCWKPFIIDRALSLLRNDDVLVYADSGCSINGFEVAATLKNELLKLLASEANISVANFWEPRYIRNWTKFELLESLGVSSNAHLLNCPQYEAGRIAFIVCDETRGFVREWLKHAKILNLIDDSPSQSPELPDFIEHRHDQSIFAILLHRHKFVTGLEKAIQATRLKS